MHMGRNFILAHDLGTTGDKVTLFDAQGRVTASAFAGYATAYPRPNWAEQNPEDWWQAVCASTRQLLTESRIQAQEIAGITFSGQMQGCVAVDRQAHPLRSAIIWADTRAVAEAQTLVERAGGMEAVYKITGHRPSPSYSGEKIMWLRTHEPEIYRQAHKFLCSKDYIVARLSGRFASDYSDASGTNLYDLQARDWSPALLKAAGLERERLPDLHPATDVVGEVQPEAAEELGLSAGTRVVIGGGDGACAAAGAGVVREGNAYAYLGSSAWIGTATSKPLYDPGMRTVTFAGLTAGAFCPIGAMQAAGGAYQWLRDVFCLLEKEAADKQGVSPYQLMDELALESEPGAKGLLFLPYLLGERSPRWNPNARGAFFGLGMEHTRADIVRATLEGITLNLRVILAAFQELGAGIQAVRLIGGGARGPAWRQIMADIFRLPVQRLALTAEATSLGAALAGGIGVGIYNAFELAEELTLVVETAYPDPALKARYDRAYELFNRAYEAFAPLYEDMATQDR
jgi:xylulokinase